MSRGFHQLEKMIAETRAIYSVSLYVRPEPTLPSNGANQAKPKVISHGSCCLRGFTITGKTDHATTGALDHGSFAAYSEQSLYSQLEKYSRGNSCWDGFSSRMWTAGGTGCKRWDRQDNGTPCTRDHACVDLYAVVVCYRESADILQRTQSFDGVTLAHGAASFAFGGVSRRLSPVRQ